MDIYEIGKTMVHEAQTRVQAMYHHETNTPNRQVSTLKKSGHNTAGTRQ